MEKKDKRGVEEKMEACERERRTKRRRSREKVVPPRIELGS